MNETINNTRIRNGRNGTGFILALFGLIGIMVMFTEAMIMPALPTLQHEFNTTAAWASWIVSIYLLVSAVAIPIFGKLGDSYGKKKFLLVCMAFYTIGVTANGFAWNLPSLIAFRALQGMGLAMFPLAFAIIRDEFPPERVPTATGIVSAMFGAGAAIGLSSARGLPILSAGVRRTMSSYLLLSDSPSWQHIGLKNRPFAPLQDRMCLGPRRFPSR